MSDDAASVLDGDLICNHCGKVIVGGERWAEPHIRCTALPTGGWLFEAVELHLPNGMVVPFIPPRPLHQCDPDPTSDISDFLREQSNGR